MFKRLRLKVARTVSAIEIPTTVPLHFPFLSTSVEERRFPLPEPSCIIFNTNTFPPNISYNECLSLSTTSVFETISILQDANGFHFVATLLNGRDVSEHLSFPSCIAFQCIFDSTTTEHFDFFLTDTCTANKFDVLPIPNTSVDISILSSLCTDITLRQFASTQIILIPADVFDNFSQIIDLSDALFFQIPPASIFSYRLSFKKDPLTGKDYSLRTSLQTDLFSDDPYSHFSGDTKTRKAYSQTKTRFAVQTTKLNIFDLILPSLQPPLLLDFVEQFDLFAPLFPFQQRGVEFLIDHTAALLADEMGTGKTVQTIIGFRVLFRQGRVRRVLIVCPLAVIGSAFISHKTGRPDGWDGHLHLWAPELTVTVVRGSPEERRLDWSFPAHIYITTYDTLRSDVESGIIDIATLTNLDCIVLDEAQNIKNREAGRSRAIKKLSSSYRWALTGTPIETKIEDVISIFEFVKPRLFIHAEYTQAEVRTQIEPYFLRRLKRDVLKDLPPKIRQEEWLELNDSQREAYNRALRSGQAQLAESVRSQNQFHIKGHIWTILAQLKQICNFAPNEDRSPKSERLLELIETINDNGEKVLLFTQYVDYGIIRLRKLLAQKSVKFVEYYGQTTQADRDQAVNKFRHDPNICVFLATVKSGGVGITLTEASYVIHFDHWWNPAVMWQAEDRAHRVGLTNPLNVYNFWTRDTVEEKIRQKLLERGLLISSVIDSLAEENIDGIITTNEWLEIFGIQERVNDKAESDKRTPEMVLSELQSMDPLEFERITKEFFFRQGYQNAKVTKQSHDGGVDVFGSRQQNGNTDSFIAQCKRTDTVGVNVARELYGVLHTHDVNASAFLITSGVFSPDCRRFADANLRLKLIDGIAFANLLIQLKIL